MTISMRQALLCGLLGATLTALAGPSHAADLMMPEPPPIEPIVAPSGLGSGWYLRGDVGYRDFGNVKDTPYGPLQFDPVPPPELTSESLKSSVTVGAGIGYQFNSWFRADVTVDHAFSSRFTAFSSASNYQNGFSYDRGKLDTSTAMANIYVDLGTWYGLTPYVGGGIGGAQLQFHQYTGQPVYFANATNLANGNVPAGTVGNYYPPASGIPSKTVTNFAYALMAGVSYDIGAGFKADLGYRYINLGNAATGLDEFGIGTKLKPIEAQEVRLGLRYVMGQ